MLTEKQAVVCSEVMASKCLTCIIHGKAGTGKSVLRDELLRQIPSAICLGPTGISVENSKLPDRVSTIAHFLKAEKSHSKVIIIDEMSMISAKDYTKLSRVIGKAKLILIGDFYQLQPPDRQYFFTCAEWKQRAHNVAVWELHDVLRIDDDDQEAREELEFLLDSLRNGSFYTSPRARSLIDYVLTKKHRHPDALVLCPTNEIADRTNQSELDKIDTEAYYGFKEGCKVQVTKNVYRGSAIIAANGALGVIDSIEGKKASVSFGERLATIPVKHLRLGYAVTVHSAQGLSLDHVHIVGPNLLDGRQHLYTAFSRARSLSGISVTNLSSYDIDSLPNDLPTPLVNFMKANRFG